MDTQTDAYTTAMKATAGEALLLPMPVRERHLEQNLLGTKQCIVQATGRELLITLWSNRDDIQISIPFHTWYAGKPRRRSIYDWRLYIERWMHLLPLELEEGRSVEVWRDEDGDLQMDTDEDVYVQAHVSVFSELPGLHDGEEA